MKLVIHQTEHLKYIYIYIYQYNLNHYKFYEARLGLKPRYSWVLATNLEMLATRPKVQISVHFIIP